MTPSSVRKSRRTKTSERVVGNASPGHGQWIVLAAILVAAGTLLFWRLGAIYLWQDEANTAVLAERFLKHGKPLGYDGVNLLTNDNAAAEDARTIYARTTSASAGVEYIVKRGDLRADTSWIYHPWGQFVVAAASIGILGKTTVAARLPFALAAFATVPLLYWLTRRATGSVVTAAAACALLLVNGSWILHGRQARYYALSSLLLVAVMAAFDRWQRGARLGAPAFVVIAWLFFQVDYGTFWPVAGVLAIAALINQRREILKPLLVLGALSVSIVPFVFFYKLANRRSVQVEDWPHRFNGVVFNTNEAVAPVVVLVTAAITFAFVQRRLAESERRLVGVSLAIIATMILWVPTVAPASFVRYVIMTAPLGAFLTAWTLSRIGQSTIVTCAAAAIVGVTAWVTLPFDSWASMDPLRSNGALVRPMLRSMVDDVFVPHKDPNRIVIDYLRAHAKPTDEILINYEDIPLMYYLSNPIRGGVAAFRVEDDSKGPPEFIVLRRSVPYVHMPVFTREMNRYTWDPITLGAPDVVWGNNPDPLGQIQNPDTARDLYIARRRPK